MGVAVTSIMVGCPIRDRAWILEPWLDHVRGALDEAGFGENDVSFVFVASGHDTATLDAIYGQLGTPEPPGLHVLLSGESTEDVVYKRNWGRARFVEMTGLRNQLLGEVRRHTPDLFWSLDSDILVHPRALASSLDLMQERAFDAVGQCCFMSSKSTMHPSFGMLGSSGLIRQYTPGMVAPVDVIMAAKLMTPAAYNVDYSSHRLGEDIGWSRNARSAGLTLGWDSTVVSKHVMNPAELTVVDDRCGF